MTGAWPVYRLSREAYDQLRLAARQDPAAYLDPDRDFAEVLRCRGVTDPFEETRVTTDRPIDLVADGVPPHRSDRQALDFYRSFDGLTASRATDVRMWAWMTHFRLHAYGLSRWRRTANIDLGAYVRSHWFSSGTADALWRHNTASRTWWMAHMAIKASRGSAGAFSTSEALDAFARTAVFYHIPMHFNFARDPVVLAEVVRVLLNEADGIASERGLYELMRQLNLVAGTRLLPLMSREVLRREIVGRVERIMSDPEMVADRSKLRNRTPFRSLSLGAGVQSTVLALMAERGEYGLPKPDVAIFADTGWEPPAVYEHLDWLEDQLSFEVVRVSAGNIKDNILAGTSPDGNNYLGIPAFLTTADGGKGVASRQCTTKYKIRPINRYLRQRVGIAPGRRAPKDVHVEIWLGISADELMREKQSREEWATNRYPLIELGFSRAQLLKWFTESYPGRTLPRSSCVGCPYRTDGEWKWLQNTDPGAFAEAVLVDRSLREDPIVRNAITRRGSAYLHPSRVPLSEVDLGGTTDYDSYMINECEGVCGI